MNTTSDVEACAQRLAIQSSAGEMAIDVTDTTQPLTAKTLSRLITEQTGHPEGSFLLYRPGDTDSQELVPLYSCDIIDAPSVFMQCGVKRMVVGNGVVCDAIMKIVDGAEIDTPAECMARMHRSNHVLEMYFTQTTEAPLLYTTRSLVWTPHDPALPASRFESHVHCCSAALQNVAQLKQWCGLAHIFNVPFTYSFRVKHGASDERALFSPGVWASTSQTTGQEMQRYCVSSSNDIEAVTTNGLPVSRFQCVESFVDRNGELLWKLRVGHLHPDISEVFPFDSPQQAKLARSVFEKCVEEYTWTWGERVSALNCGWKPSMPFPPHEILQRPDWSEAFERLCNILSQSTHEMHQESLLCIRLSVAVDAIVRDPTAFGSLCGTIDDLTACLPLRPGSHITEMTTLWKAFRAAYASDPAKRLLATKRSTDSRHAFYDSYRSKRRELLDCVVVFNQHPNDNEQSMYELGRLPYWLEPALIEVSRSISDIRLGDDAELQFVIPSWTDAKRPKQQAFSL